MSVPREYNLRRHFVTNYRNYAELNANEKSIDQILWVLIVVPSKHFFSFLAVKVLLVPELALKFQEKFLLQEKVSPMGSFLKNAC